MPTERELTTEWEHLQHWLGPDPEQAGVRYEALRRKLIDFFAAWDCAPADEWADKVFDVTARRLAAGLEIRAAEHATYCLGVARMLRHDYRRAPERKLIPLAAAPDLRAGAQGDEAERRLACLSDCLHRLPDEDRQLIEDYYDDDARMQIARRKSLARRLKLASVGLRTRASRIRERLARCVKACVARTQK